MLDDDLEAKRVEMEDLPEGAQIELLLLVVLISRCSGNPRLIACRLSDWK
jgi:hypothetical protein